MFGQTIARGTGLVTNARYFRSNVRLRDVKQGTNSSNVAEAKPKYVDPEQVLGPKMTRPSNFDKWLLVWMKKFPSKEQVPEKVTRDVLLKAQSQARVRTANCMIAFTILGCIGAVWLGKKQAAEGKNVGRENAEWHKKINEEYRAERMAAGAAKSS